MDKPTLTVKTEKVKKEEVELEISLPFFSKCGCNFYKVESEDRIISVWILETSARISVRDLKIELKEAISAEEATQDEFNEAFAKALSLINNKS